MLDAFLDYVCRKAKDVVDCLPKVVAWVRAIAPELPMPLGWGLLTLSAFGFSVRAWEASVGCYLIFTVVLKFLEVFLVRKAAALRSRADN